NRSSTTLTRTPRWRSESAFADARYLLIRSRARSPGDSLPLEEPLAVHLGQGDRGDQGGPVEDLLDVALGAEQLEARGPGGQEVDRDEGAERVDPARLDRGDAQEDRGEGGEDQVAA